MRLLVCISLLLAAMPLSARTPLQQCAVGDPSGFVLLDVFDLGNGLTSHLTNSDATGTHLVVTSCHTGNFLSATVVDKAGSVREFPETLTAFESATDGQAVASLEIVAKALETARVPVFYGVNRSETCACRAAYPGLRGTKLENGKP